MDSTTQPGNVPPPDWRQHLREQLQRHGRWLQTVISARSGGDSQAVEDVFQEVALAVVQQPIPLLDMAKTAPWLYQTAVRQALQYRRRVGRQRRRDTIAAQRQHHERWQHTMPMEPLLWLIHEERRQIVRSALAELRPRDREILLLKYTESWSYLQLANHLGISTSAVESRLQRARERLRRRLQSTHLESSET